MTDLGPQGRGRIRDLLDDRELSPRKSLGQHFLTDPNVTRRIVRVAGVGPDSRVVEVGGGTGTLTAALAETEAAVIVYEIDDGLVAVLRDTVGTRPNVEVRHADITKVDLQQALSGDGWHLVANLPYNIGTGIVLDTLQSVPRIHRLVAMLQTEVADRLFARPGSKAYGLPSVVAALYGTGGPEFTVRRELFYPRPEVGSTVVAVDRADPPELAGSAVELAAAAFQQRRKMLRRSLANVLDDPERVLEAAGVDPTARAENLDPAAFVRIARAEAKLRRSPSGPPRSGKSGKH